MFLFNIHRFCLDVNADLMYFSSMKINYCNYIDICLKIQTRLCCFDNNKNFDFINYNKSCNANKNFVQRKLT